MTAKPDWTGYNTGMPTKRKHSGDDGTTVILGADRLAKFHPRIEMLGALDEASAALGFARSQVEVEKVGKLILEVQKQLYLLMAEIASAEVTGDEKTRIQAAHLEWIDTITKELELEIELPHEFILPGDTAASAALAMARTAIRRAERQLVKLIKRKDVNNPLILPWINRLSSLFFLLEIYCIHAAGKKPTTVK